MARRLSDWIETYLDYTEKSESPDVFHYWTAISTIAGALRRRVWIDQKYFAWLPNFYVLLVAPAGLGGKSTTINIGMNLLREVPDIRFGPEVITWQALVQSMAAAKELVEIPGQQTDDLLAENYMPMSCLTIVSDEFGTLMNPNDRELVDVLTSLWDGKQGVWKKSTKTQGEDVVENPWINIIAGTTPAWLGGHVPRHMLEGGFFSRTIVVFADRKRQLVAYPASQISSDKFTRLRDDLIHDLEQISQLFGEYSLEPAAQAWGEAWYERHYASLSHSGDLTALGGYAARKQTHMHKLAMILAASVRDERVITKGDLQHAERLLSLVEKDMRRLFDLAGEDRAVRQQNEVLLVMQKIGRCPEKMLFRALSTRMGYADFEKALQSAIATGKVRRAPAKGDNLLVYFGPDYSDLPEEPPDAQSANS